MMRFLLGFTWRGSKIVIIDRVKPGKLYTFQRYLLVHPDQEDALVDWMVSTATMTAYSMDPGAKLL